MVRWHVWRREVVVLYARGKVVVASVKWMDWERGEVMSWTLNKFELMPGEIREDRVVEKFYVSIPNQCF